jgi:hydrogenase maturation protease
MKDSKTDLLIVGIGNKGRQDDGLAWTFLDRLQDQLTANVQLVYRYQLNVEDAELISSVPRVVFIDAKISGNNQPFEFTSCTPKESFEFTTHALGPQVVLALCHNLFQSFPETHLLTITGYEWELKEGLGKKAKGNLDQALKYFKEKVLSTLKVEANT